MKKYILIAVGSLSLSIILIFQLYQVVDIDFVDDIVEKTTQTLGIKPDFIERKIERKIEQKKFEEQLSKIELEVEEPMDELVGVDSASNDDEAKSISFLAGEELVASNEVTIKGKAVFNAAIDVEANKRAEEEKKLKLIADSIRNMEALAAAKPKRKVFNSSFEEEINGSGNSNPRIQYFEAKVHGAQRFGDNDEVVFRTVKSIDINGTQLPDNYVFKTKVNVFDGKIHFYIKELNSLKVSGENYSDDQRGIIVKPDLVFDKNTFLVNDGMNIRFGIANNL